MVSPPSFDIGADGILVQTTFFVRFDAVNSLLSQFTPRRALAHVPWKPRLIQDIKQLNPLPERPLFCSKGALPHTSGHPKRTGWSWLTCGKIAIYGMLARLLKPIVHHICTQTPRVRKKCGKSRKIGRSFPQNATKRLPWEVRNADLTALQRLRLAKWSRFCPQCGHFLRNSAKVTLSK